MQFFRFNHIFCTSEDANIWVHCAFFLSRWSTWAPSRVTVVQFMESFAKKESKNSWQSLKTSRYDPGNGLQVKMSLVVVLINLHVENELPSLCVGSSSSFFKILNRILSFLLRMSSQLEGLHRRFVLLSGGRRSSRCLWIRFAGAVAELHSDWQQAGEEMHTESWF